MPTNEKGKGEWRKRQMNEWIKEGNLNQWLNEKKSESNEGRNRWNKKEEWNRGKNTTLKQHTISKKGDHPTRSSHCLLQLINSLHCLYSVLKNLAFPISRYWRQHSLTACLTSPLPSGSPLQWRPARSILLLSVANLPQWSTSIFVTSWNVR